MSGATQQIADFVVRRRSEASPTADAVGTALLDTTAVAVAGMTEESSRILLDWVASEPAAGKARIWGTDLLAGPSQAALVNGMASHALDWDDAVPTIPMHPAAVLIPALLAGLSATAASGADLVHAYDVGSAVGRAVSEALPIDVHYGRGWHNTSTTGRLAATAGLAHLHRLDETQTRHALGIASSSVAGSLANFGTMTKPLHAGQAARDAVVAVELARRGFTAHPHQLEAPRGFFALYGSHSDLSLLPQRLEHWEHAWVTDWMVKRHPSCFATHRAIDAALRHDLDPTAVAAVRVSAPGGWDSPLLKHPPRTGLEGKFSLEYTVARALCTGAPTPADFTDDAVHDPGVRSIMDVLSVRWRESPDQGTHATVEITLVDGSTHSETAHVPYGDAGNPLTEADVEAKFTAALTFAGWPTDRASALSDRLRTAPYDADLGWLQDVLAEPD